MLERQCQFSPQTTMVSCHGQKQYTCEGSSRHGPCFCAVVVIGLSLAHLCNSTVASERQHDLRIHIIDFQTSNFQSNFGQTLPAVPLDLEAAAARTARSLGSLVVETHSTATNLAAPCRGALESSRKQGILCTWHAMNFA